MSLLCVCDVMSSLCVCDVNDVIIVCASVISGFMILIGAAVMSLVFIGALKFTSRQYPQNYICLAMFVSRLSHCRSIIVLLHTLQMVDADMAAMLVYRTRPRTELAKKNQLPYIHA